MGTLDGRLRAWQRGLIGWLCVALAVLPLAACGTPQREPEPKTVYIAAVVIDEQRLAGRDETVELTITHAGARLPGRAGMTLEKGDRVETGRNVTAVIRWPGLGDAYLRPDTAATIGSLDDFVGRAFVKVRGFFAAQTRLVGTIAKGTAFLLRGMADGSLEVTVFESEVEMSSRNGRWAPLTLKAGETAIGSMRGPSAAAASEAELISTREWVGRVEKLLAPSSTQSGSNTGAAVAVGIAAIVGAILLSRNKGSKPPAAGTSAAPTDNSTINSYPKR